MISREKKPVKFRFYLLVLFHQCIFGIFVHLGVVFDVLGAIGVAESAQGLVVVVLGRSDVGEHERLGVATERVLQ